MPVRRSLDQQREKALRRALGTGPTARAVSAETLRRARAAFEVRRVGDTPMASAIDNILRQYPVARQVRAPRLPGAGRARTALWLSLGVTCEVAAAVLLLHSAAWCATFASFGLAAALYGITQWQKGTASASGLPPNDRDDWRRAGLRYDAAWTIVQRLDLPDSTGPRLHALHATLLRLLPLALNPASQSWSLQERVSLESTIGDYFPEAIRAYDELPSGTAEGVQSLERQLDHLQDRLNVLENSVAQRGHQRQHAHERFLDRPSAPPEGLL